MNKFLFTLLIFFFTLNSGAQSITLHDSNGGVFSSKSFQNKWLVINYWADWCDNCKDEIPDLNKFYQQNKDPSVLFYGVNYDGAPLADLQQMIKANHMSYPNLVEDPATMWQLGEIEAVPVTFIINPQGKVAKKIYGSTTADSLQQTLKTLKNEK